MGKDIHDGHSGSMEELGYRKTVSARTPAQKALEAFKYSNNWSEWVSDHEEVILAALQSQIDAPGDAAVREAAGTRGDAQQKLGELVMCWLDTGGKDYMQNRKSAAEISGVPAMAITFDEHLEKIKDKIRAVTRLVKRWRPIETAPKKYSHPAADHCPIIWLWVDELKESYLGYWSPGEGCFRFSGDDGPKDCQPTMWMEAEVPQPPEAATKPCGKCGAGE